MGKKPVPFDLQYLIVFGKLTANPKFPISIFLNVLQNIPNVSRKDYENLIKQGIKKQLLYLQKKVKLRKIEKFTSMTLKLLSKQCRGK